MNTSIRVVNAYADYVLADDMSRAIITFRFPASGDTSRITLLHDTCEIEAKAYTLNKQQSMIALSAESGEGIVINIWDGAQLLASGVYVVDLQGEEEVLRTVCGADLALVQAGMRKSDLECSLVDGGTRYAGD